MQALSSTNYTPLRCFTHKTVAESARFCYSEHMSSSKERQQAIKKLRCMFFAPKLDVKAFRERIEATLYAPFLPNHVEATDCDYGGILCDVLYPEMYASRKIAIYVHGGSFVAGSRRAYRSFCASLAHAISCRMVVPEFRLAPAHPYPAALEDVQAVFRAVYTEEQVARSLDADGDDTAAPELIIMADGSGASIALAVLMSMKERFRGAVSHVVLFSPWLDVSEKNKHLAPKKARDEVFTADAIRRSAELYTYQENQLNPLVSPLRASKDMLKGLPPIFIQLGEKELFLDDAEQFMANLKDAGSDCDIDMWKDMMPLFQLADDALEESHLAIEKIGSMITGRNVRKGESAVGIGIELEHSTYSEL